MPLDPQAEDFLRKFNEMDIPALENLSLEQIRTLPTPIAGDVEDVAKVEDRVVVGVDGNEIPIRIYWPEGWSDLSEPLPGFVLIHGGGWVMGTLDLYDSLGRSIANAGNCVVASVDYRLAPEHRFPAAAEDSHSATAFVCANAESLGIDPARVIVGGDSAGGNLAVVVCLIARDRQSCNLAGQVLVYPIADCDFETPSYVDNSDGYFLTRASMQWFWDQYASNEERKHPYASPLKADSLENLPPAWVMTAHFDPLRDEGEKLAERLAADGVATHLERFEGQIHGFLRRTDLYDEASRAIGLIGQFIQQR